MLISKVSLGFDGLRTNPFHFFIVAFEQLLCIEAKPEKEMSQRVFAG